MDISKINLLKITRVQLAKVVYDELSGVSLRQAVWIADAILKAHASGVQRGRLLGQDT